jgi:hypothetical protein
VSSHSRDHRSPFAGAGALSELCSLVNSVAKSSVALEILHGALVFFGLLARVEGPQIATFTGLRIYLARIEPVFTRLKFSDHCLFTSENSFQFSVFSFQFLRVFAENMNDSSNIISKEYKTVMTQASSHRKRFSVFSFQFSAGPSLSAETEN